MDKRRAFLQSIYILAFALLWMNLAPKLFPQFFPQAQQPGQAQQVAEVDEPQEAEGEEPGDAAPDGDENAAVEAADEPELEENPQQTIELGSLDPESGYFMRVTIDSAGAAITSVELNDPRYTSIDNQAKPLTVVGANQALEDKTLQMSIDKIDAQLKQFDTSLSEVNWKVVAAKENEAQLSFTAPDQSVELIKTFRLNQGDVENPDEDANGYLVDFDLSIRNLSDAEQGLSYEMLGPVGLPLEDRENSREFIGIKVGTLDDPSDPTDVSDIAMTAAALVKAADKAKRMDDPSRVETWRAPIQYVGVDVQYFAALILPQGNQVNEPYFDRVDPIVEQEDAKNANWSDPSVRLTSQELVIPAGGDVTHSFKLFFGPKRSELLEPIGAEGVKALGWFSVVALGMLSMLHFFHKTMMLPYGLAIMALTVVVRACLFPISRKIAKNQARMKELQPKMEEIRTKYKDDKEKQAEAYREFMAKNGFNPLAGCLPMFLQLPIFFGLYRALAVSVDLRNAQFLWIDNLAAPDKLFPLPFTVPIVGWTDFNVLPLVTVALFMAQQKLFMPPPTSEEQAMQYKMMNYFTLFIGFMFYRVPAGLCVYFITSSLWGICERKLLEKLGYTSTTPSADGDAGEDGGLPPKKGAAANNAAPAPPQKKGFLATLMEAADEAQRQNQKRQEENRNTNGTDTSNRKNKKKNRKSKGRR